MSDPHRAERRRAARAAASSHNIVVQLGWCATEADLAELYQATHDMLINGLGALRTSGVEWRTFHGETAQALLQTALDNHPGDEDAEYRTYLEKMREHLNTHGGYIVAASCAANRVN